MKTANKAYETAIAVVEKSETWQYLEERIEWHVSQGHVQMFVSFDHNPQTAMLMLRDFGYTVTPQTIDRNAKYYGFVISWFPMNKKEVS